METSDKTTYLVISGNMTSTKSPVEYVEHIVYGNPRIEAVLVGSHFVALCEYPESQWTQCRYTFERMGSFPHGVKLMGDLLVALQEFGTMVRHWAPGTIAGLSETVRHDQNLVADMEAEGLL